MCDEKNHIMCVFHPECIDCNLCCFTNPCSICADLTKEKEDK